MNLKKPYMCKEEERENFHPAIQMQDPGLGGQLQRLHSTSWPMWVSFAILIQEVSPCHTGIEMTPGLWDSTSHSLLDSRAAASCPELLS